MLVFLLCGLVAKSCQTLCDPTDFSSPGSSVHWIFQVRILKLVAISFSSLLSIEPANLVIKIKKNQFVLVEEAYCVIFFFFLQNQKLRKQENQNTMRKNLALSRHKSMKGEMREGAME